MALVRLKQKGQVTIPARLRVRLRLEEGSMFEVDTDGRAIMLTPKTVVERGDEGSPGEASTAEAFPVGSRRRGGV